jgi:hypothetical protein
LKVTEDEKTQALFEARDLLNEAETLMDQMAVEQLIETGILQAKINFFVNIMQQVYDSTDDQETKDAIKTALEINEAISFTALTTNTDGETKH